jgi:glycosyltransferase involved in cell wall biosynthesis
VNLSNKANPRILYISYDGMTDSLGESQVIAYLKRLSSEGFDYDLISFEKKEEFKKKKSIIEDHLKGTSINWIPLYYTKNPPIFSTIKDMINGWRKIKNMQSSHHYDIVHCRGYIASILGLRFKNLSHAKFIFDMRGWLADEKYESGNWKGFFYKFIYNYFKRQEKLFFKESDFTVSLTHVGKDFIVNNHYKESEKVGVIPTCVDFDIFKSFNPAIRSEIRKKLSIPDLVKVMVYSGSLGGNYNIEDILKIYFAFRRINPDAIFLAVSNTDPKIICDYLERKSLNQDSIRVVSVNFNEVYKYLHASDVGIILYNLDFSAIGRSPTKLGEYWACGIPMVSRKGIGDLEKIIGLFPQGGILLDNLEESNLASAFDSDIILKPDKELLRKYSLDYFDVKKGVEFYKKIYLNLIKP